MVGEGFPPSARLKRSVDFQRIQKSGQRFHTKHFVVCFVQGTQPAARYGLTVSRRVGNAVARNRVKRWLREGIRRSLHELCAVDVVFIAKPASATAGQMTISQEVATTLNRIRRA